MKGDAVQQAALAKLVPEEQRIGLAARVAQQVDAAAHDPYGRHSLGPLELPPRAQLAILLEVALERVAQDAKWGQQDHPLVDPLLAEQNEVRGMLGVLERMAQEYEIPTAPRAKFLTDVAARRGNRITFAHIATEEQSEFVEAATIGDLWAARQEAIQAAAVWVQVVERIDRMVASAQLGAQLPPVKSLAERAQEEWASGMIFRPELES